MKNSHLEQSRIMGVVAFLLVFSSVAVNAEAASTSPTLFQVSEIQGLQLAENEQGQQCASHGGVRAGNPVTNNKFTEHVCAAHVFHPKRKAMEARERKSGKEHQCASKPSTK